MLKDIAGKIDPMKLPLLLNDRRADLMLQQLKKPLPGPEHVQLRRNYITELINSGRNEQAIEEIARFKAKLESVSATAWEKILPEMLQLEAMACLRMGEEQNCCQRNNHDSCLLPIQGEGIHQKREGSTRAIEVLTQLLQREPQNLRARWLLNIAHMTLGTYPREVPAQYLIPPGAFASEYPLPRFDNVAQQVGLDLFGLAGGSILDDFDNDGFLDLLVSGMGFEEQTRYFHNGGDGTFEDRTLQAGLAGEVGGLNMISADYDNDGNVDAVILRGGWLGKTGGSFPLSLLKNDGRGRFVDVTRSAGLLRFAPTQTAAWLDYDGDGWLDLFVGNESLNGEDFPCQLFHSNRDGTFTDLARECGVDVVKFAKGVVSGDYNNDDRPDIFIAVMGGEKLLFRNDGPAPGGKRGVYKFTEVGAQAGITQPINSFGTFFFDYDNDGWQDLFVAGYGLTMAEGAAADLLGIPTKAERGRLYHNRGDGTFQDVTREMGLYKVVIAMGINFGDLDNDGFLDFYAGTGNPDLSTLVPNRMFRNDEGRRFQDVTTAGDFGHLQKGHAVSFGDIDNDGDQDIYIKMGGALSADKAYSALFENPGNSNRWISLQLQGVKSNRCAIGARIKVTVDSEKGPRDIFRVVSSGASFGCSPLRQEIGLGAATRLAAVEVHWPATGQTQKIEGLEMGKRYRIIEGDASPAPLASRSFALSRATAERVKTGLGRSAN